MVEYLTEALWYLNLNDAAEVAQEGSSTSWPNGACPKQTLEMTFAAELWWLAKKRQVGQLRREWIGPFCWHCSRHGHMTEWPRKLSRVLSGYWGRQGLGTIQWMVNVEEMGLELERTRKYSPFSLSDFYVPQTIVVSMNLGMFLVVVLMDQAISQMADCLGNVYFQLAMLLK